MAEDQGWNGNRWTDEATVLLSQLGWEKVADTNIDITGLDGKRHGIDALFRYEDGFSEIMQGVFLEAKNYATSSFNLSKLQDWITRLDDKILELRRSQEFNKNYPKMAETIPQNGLLLAWFHDNENYLNYRHKIDDALNAIRTPRKQKVMSNRLFVLSNGDILRLASLVEAKKKWDRENQSDGLDYQMKFFYPASVKQGLFPQRLAQLNLEYMFSKFILAKSQILEFGQIKEVNFVFYFGELSFSSFERLKQALLKVNIPTNQSKLYVYTYQRDREFRKVKPDVQQLFNAPSVDFEIKTMNLFSDLPDWMKDLSLE